MAPSESREKVLAAVRKVLPEATEASGRGTGGVELVSERVESLVVLHDQLRDRRVRGAARRLLLARLRGSSTSIILNRQAASAGVVALCSSEEQSPLGPIVVTIESKGVQAVIDWLSSYDAG